MDKSFLVEIKGLNYYLILVFNRIDLKIWDEIMEFIFLRC